MYLINITLICIHAHTQCLIIKMISREEEEEEEEEASSPSISHKTKYVPTHHSKQSTPLRSMLARTNPSSITVITWLSIIGMP